MKSINYELPIDFHQKINLIKEINLDDKIEDEMQLLKFLKNSKPILLRINLSNSLSYSSEFYNELIELNLPLVSALVNPTDEIDLFSNQLDFIYKLNLKILNIQKPISIEYLIKLVEMNSNKLSFVRMKDSYELDNFIYDEELNIQFGKNYGSNCSIKFITSKRNSSTGSRCLNLFKNINFNSKSQRLHFLKLIKDLDLNSNKFDFKKLSDLAYQLQKNHILERKVFRIIKNQPIIVIDKKVLENSLI